MRFTFIRRNYDFGLRFVIALRARANVSRRKLEKEKESRFRPMAVPAQDSRKSCESPEQVGYYARKLARSLARARVM